MSFGSTLKTFEDIVELLKKDNCIRDLIPEVTNLVRIMLTLPVSTCTSERFRYRLALLVLRGSSIGFQYRLVQLKGIFRLATIKNLLAFEHESA